MQTALPDVSIPGAFVALALLLIFSWAHLRHAGLAVQTVAAPSIGFALSVFLLKRGDAVCYVAGYMAAGFLSASIATQATHIPSSRAVSSSLRTLWMPLCVALFFASIVPLIAEVPLQHVSRTDFAMAFGLAAAAITGIALTASGALFLPYREAFVIRLNRALEAHERRLQSFAFLSQPRWGFSIGGSALVFFALGFFGIRNAQGATGSGIAVIIVAVLASLILFAGYVVTRNFRRAFAAALAVELLALLSIWLASRWRVVISDADLGLSVMVAAIPMLLTAANAATLERNGDQPAMATTRSIEQNGAATFSISVSSAIALALAGGAAPTALIESAIMVLGGIAALILQPALSTMLYALFPKRVSLNAYKLR